MHFCHGMTVAEQIYLRHMTTKACLGVVMVNMSNKYELKIMEEEQIWIHCWRVSLESRRLAM